jgi:hypothetical protein
MEFKIMTNVEKPTARRNRNGRNAVYPFGKLAVKQSWKQLFLTDDSEERDKISRRIRTASLSYHKTHPEFVFETWTGLKANGRPEDQDGDGIWVRRIEKKPETSQMNGLALNAVFDSLGDDEEEQARRVS